MTLEDARTLTRAADTQALAFDDELRVVVPAKGCELQRVVHRFYGPSSRAARPQPNTVNPPAGGSQGARPVNRLVAHRVDDAGDLHLLHGDARAGRGPVFLLAETHRLVPGATRALPAARRWHTRW